VIAFFVTFVGIAGFVAIVVKGFDMVIAFGMVVSWVWEIIGLASFDSEKKFEMGMGVSVAFVVETEEGSSEKMLPVIVVNGLVAFAGGFGVGFVGPSGVVETQAATTGTEAV